MWEVPDRQLSDERRINLLAEFSRSRRVQGNHTLLDVDVTKFLGPSELDEFRTETGLRRSPVTLVLPNRSQSGQDRAERVLVAFLHGFGGSRGSWGIGNPAFGRQEGLVSNVLRAVERSGRDAIGVVLAGLGRDGGNVDAPVCDQGLTPAHYSRQLDYVLRHLDLYDCDRIVGIGHSVGSAALWEYARTNFSSEAPSVPAAGRRPKLSLVSISPVRALADNWGLKLGCHIAGEGLDLLTRPLVHLWRYSNQRLLDLVGMASVLKGLAQQGPFTANLSGIKGLVVVGEHDWIARMGLSVGLQRASCAWPIALLAGLGHNLLWHPDTVRALVHHMPTLL
jgi:pimeloyl-ACP methyl ester carboxylesterase